MKIPEKLPEFFPEAATINSLIDVVQAQQVEIELVNKRLYDLESVTGTSKAAQQYRDLNRKEETK